MNSNSSVSGTMSLDRSTMQEVIEKSVGLLENKCIRLNGHEPNWRALISEHSDEITRSASPRDFETRMSEVLGRGGLSHVAFFHESGLRAPPATPSTRPSAGTTRRPEAAGCFRMCTKAGQLTAPAFVPATSS